MSLPSNIRVNVGAPFPSQVSGAAFVAVTKANGIWTIAPNYALLGASPSISPTQVFVVFDPATGLYSLTNMGWENSYRTITAPGDVAVASTDLVILLNKTVGAATAIDLPASSSRNGLPVTAKDLKGDSNLNNITFVPASGETIDGFSAAAAAANGAAVIATDYGKKTLFPLTSGGWYL